MLSIKLTGEKFAAFDYDYGVFGNSRLNFDLFDKLISSNRK